MNRYCLALDLKDDETLIKKYEEYHLAVWPEIKNSILEAGVQEMEIYRIGTRMFMIIHVKDDFSFDNWDQVNKKYPKVKEWEELMSTFQQPIPWAKPGEKWVLMDKIYQLTKN